eukprot:751557-Hanusia_phi.AAC.2
MAGMEMERELGVESIAVRPGTMRTDIARESAAADWLLGRMDKFGLLRPLSRAAHGVLLAALAPGGGGGGGGGGYFDEGIRKQENALANDVELRKIVWKG